MRTVEQKITDWIVFCLFALALLTALGLVGIRQAHGAATFPSPMSVYLDTVGGTTNAPLGLYRIGNTLFIGTNGVGGGSGGGGTGAVNPWTNSFSAGGFGLTNLSLLATTTLTIGGTNVFQLFDPAGAVNTLSNWFNLHNTTFSNWTITSFDTNGAAASVAATLGDLAHSNSATYSTQFDTNGAARALTRYFDFHQITNATPVNGLVYSGYNSNLVCSTTIPFGMTFNGNLTVNGTVSYNTVVNNFTTIQNGTNYVNQTIYTTNYSYQVTIMELATNVLSVVGGWVFNNSYLNGTNMSFMSAPHFTDTKGSNLVATGAWDWSGASWLNPPTNGWVFGTTGALTNSGGVLTSTNGIVSLSTNGWQFGTPNALTNSGGVLTSTNGIVSLSTNGWQFGTPNAITNISGGGAWNITNGTGTFTPTSVSDNTKANSNNTYTVIVNGTTNVSVIGQSSTLNLGNIATVTGSVNYATTAGNGLVAVTTGSTNTSAGLLYATVSQSSTGVTVSLLGGTNAAQAATTYVNAYQMMFDTTTDAARSSDRTAIQLFTTNSDAYTLIGITPTSVGATLRNQSGSATSTSTLEFAYIVAPNSTNVWGAFTNALTTNLTVVAGQSPSLTTVSIFTNATSLGWLRVRLLTNSVGIYTTNELTGVQIK